MRNIFFIDRPPDPANTIFLAGSGRSGTTWLVSLINHDHAFRYMFEPFRRQKVPRCQPFNDRQYLRPGAADPAYLDVARDVVSGAIRRWWIDKYNRRFRCDRRLIKDIRANLLLRWLHEHFPSMKIVFLLRHPGAVAQSRMGRGWNAPLEEVLSQKELIEDHLEDYLGANTEPRDVFERHVLLWCIENLVPLKQFEPGSMHVMYYEHLCLDPTSQLSSMCAAIDLEFDISMLRRIHRPSRQAQPRSPVRHGKDLIKSWKSALNTSQIDRMETILARFGLDAIYTSDVMPHAPDPLALFGERDHGDGHGPRQPA